MAYNSHADPNQGYGAASGPYMDHPQQPHPFRTSSTNSASSQDELHSPNIHTAGNNNPYYHSNPSLPRYSSQQQLNHPSPLNPAASQQRQMGPASSNNSSRFSSYNGGYAEQPNRAHPLSNAMYADSSPTLAGSEILSPSDEKMRLNQGDHTGQYILPTQAQPMTQGQTFGRNTQPRGPLKATGLTKIYRAWSGANLADSGKDERHVKLPRLGYLDGIKFLAAWVALNGTYFAAVIDEGDYAAIGRNSPLYITRSFGLGITFLLLLSGRSLVTPLWDVASPNSINGTKSNTALISWARLTRAMLIRPFRFILPVIAVAALQWGLSSSGRTRNCNAVGMDEPYWGLISSFSGLATVVFDSFTTFEANTLAGQTFAGNLWISAWFFQSSFAVYVIHMMLGNLSSNRYWVYALLATFSWTTFNYFYVAILGLVLADMHAHGHLHRIRTKWPAVQRIGLHAVLIIIACVLQFVPIIRDNVNSGMATINVQNHPELTFCDSVFAFFWLFCIETSGLAQKVFGNIFMRTLGKFSAGMVLLAPAIVFTIVPDLALTLSGNGSSASSVLGVSWLVCFIIVFVISILFHFVVELPSKMAGEVISELLEHDSNKVGNGHASAMKSVGGKLLKKNPGGAAQQTAPGMKPKPVLV